MNYKKMSIYVFKCVMAYVLFMASAIHAMPSSSSSFARICVACAHRRKLKKVLLEKTTCEKTTCAICFDEQEIQ